MIIIIIIIIIILIIIIIIIIIAKLEGGERRSPGPPSPGPPSALPPSPRRALRRTALRLTAQNFAHFFLSSGKTSGFGAAGASHDNPRTPNVNISGPRRFKHHQNSTRRHPKRGKNKRNLWWEREKKREFLGLPPFGAPPFGAPPFGASTLRGSHPSGLPPFGAPTLPTFLGSGPHPSGLHFSGFWASPLNVLSPPSLLPEL